MSHDERIALVNLIDELLSGRLGQFIGWLRWLVLAVIAGTVAVVGFVFEVRAGVRALQQQTDSQVRRIDTLEVEQRDMGKLVQRHDAILSRHP